MSRTRTRTHTKWKPNEKYKPVIDRIQEQPRSRFKRRLRAAISLKAITSGASFDKS